MALFVFVVISCDLFGGALRGGVLRLDGAAAGGPGRSDGGLRERRAQTRGGHGCVRTGAPRAPRSFAFLGDLVTWVGVLRRSDRYRQADLKYRAADVWE